MAWFWTDDLARAAVDAGWVTSDAVQDWVERPVALAAPEDADPLELAARQLGLDPAAGAA